MINFWLIADIGTAPDPGMYDLLEKILRSVSFIAIGGAVALMFFLVFAQTIMGSRTIHAQLQKLLKETEKMNEQLGEIAGHLKKNGPEDRT